jgi:hypothetical protein
MPDNIAWRPHYVLGVVSLSTGKSTSRLPILEGYDLVDRGIGGRVYASIRPRGDGWAFYGTTFSGWFPQLDAAKKEVEEMVRRLKPHAMNRRPEEG